MIRINFDPEIFFADGANASLRQGWDELIEKARIATEKVIKEWEEYKQLLGAWQKNPGQGEMPEFRPTFSQPVWTAFRDWFSENIFHGKCAYCECSLNEETIPDAEHFRPKREIALESESKKAKTKDEDGVEITHPGYFWLAYNWKNLLPSCHLCNRYGGKKSKFPARSYFLVSRFNADEIDNLVYREIKSETWEEIYYLQPEDLDEREGRLLLHPFYDCPEDHICFDGTGKAFAKHDSPEGVASIETFGLNDGNRIRHRNRGQKDAFNTIMIKILGNQEGRETMQAAAERALRQYFQGDGPYASAVYEYFKEQLGQSYLVPPIERLLPERKARA